ncbi:hypothetical protein [Paenibacillus sanguinis]|uniref:hypothetical protein n=1 Tax=Paenibacillus sanguinis TaxID=225906 RepID=UPI00037F87DF|nr:hypothetical protein [Paenibacillus sanguinis]
MMMLLKYEWKRNANTLLSVFFVLIVAQIVVATVGHYGNWIDAGTVALSIMMYVAAVMIMIVTVSKTFSYNIRAYHWRLLPVHPVWTILSPLLLSWLVLIVLLGIMAIHGGLYFQFSDYPFGLEQVVNSLVLGDWLLVVGQIVWLYTLLIIVIFVSMLIGASVSIRGKAGIWIAILSFFIIQYVLFWVEDVFFSEDTSGFMSGVLESESGAVTIEAVLTWGPFLFEFVVVCLFVWMMSYLLKRRVQI